MEKITTATLNKLTACEEQLELFEATFPDGADVDEAYTSKTCSWSGEMINNLGGRKVVRGVDGVKMDRDMNGARGIFLRALTDTSLSRTVTRMH